MTTVPRNCLQKGPDVQESESARLHFRVTAMRCLPWMGVTRFDVSLRNESTTCGTHHAPGLSWVVAMKGCMYVFVGLAGVGLLAFAALIWWVATGVIQSAEYEDRDAAVDAIERGWLPAWIPKSAKDIQESHDVDTYQGFATFKFDPEEVFYSGCSPETLATSAFGVPSWEWPRFMNEALRRVNRDESLQFFRCGERRDRSVAVDRAAGVAYISIDVSGGIPP